MEFPPALLLNTPPPISRSSPISVSLTAFTFLFLTSVPGKFSCCHCGAAGTSGEKLPVTPPPPQLKMMVCRPVRGLFIYLSQDRSSTFRGPCYNDLLKQKPSLSVSIPFVADPSHILSCLCWGGNGSWILKQLLSRGWGGGCCCCRGKLNFTSRSATLMTV